MIIVEKNAGRKVEWEQNGCAVLFANGELPLDCAACQRDWSVHIDICSGPGGRLVTGTEGGQNYVAQIDIPAREYDYPEAAPAGDASEGEGMGGNTGQAQPAPRPLDMDKVTLSLWAL